MFFFVAVIIACLSGMGVGGGGLFALYLKYFSDYSQIDIQAINLLFFLFASGAALAVHLTRRRIYFGAVVLMIFFGAAGSLIGSSLAVRLDGNLLSKLFGAMMILAGVYSLFRKRSADS